MSPLFITTAVFLLSVNAGGLIALEDGLYEILDILTAISMSFITMWSFYFGYLFFLGQYKKPQTKSAIVTDQHKKLSLPIVNAIISVAAGVLILIKLIDLLGFSSITEVFFNLLIFRERWGAGGMSYLMYLALFLIEAPYWMWLLHRRKPFKPSLLFVLYTSLVVAVFILTGARIFIMNLALRFLLVWNMRVSKITPKKSLKILFIFLPFLSFFFYMQGIFRGENMELMALQSGMDSYQFFDSVYLFIHRLSDSYLGFIEVVSKFDNIDLLWGKSFVNALSMPIPRAIYPDKPHSFNMETMYTLYPHLKGVFFGTGYSMYAELLLNGHVFGLIVGGVIYGYIVAFLNGKYIRHKNNNNLVFFVFYKMIITLPFWFYSGGLINNADAYSILLLSLLFFTLFKFLLKVRDKKDLYL